VFSFFYQHPSVELYLLSFFTLFLLFSLSTSFFSHQYNSFYKILGYSNHLGGGNLILGEVCLPILGSTHHQKLKYLQQHLYYPFGTIVF